MSLKREQLNKLLTALQADRLDTLGADDVARLEEALNRDAQLAAQVGVEQPQIVDRGTLRLLRATDDLPSAGEWEQMWAKIQLACVKRPMPSPAPLPRVMPGLARAALALAACVGFALLIRHPAAQPDGVIWAIEISTSLQVEEIEAPDAQVSFDYVDGDSGPLMLWFTDDEEAT